MRTPAVALALIATAAATVAAEDLPTFLKAATAAARPAAPLRADGTLVTASPDGTARDQVALVMRPNGDLYVELRNAGVRALLLGDGKTALLVPGQGKASESFALDASLGDSEFTREDLRPFDAAFVRSPIIVDRGDGDVTLSLTPAPSQYVLQVITFDSETKSPLVVKNYKDKLSNLLKLRRARQLAAAGGTWMPGELSMENFPMRTTSTMTLHWQPTADTPALFDPAALGQPSPLTWPQAAAP